ncbi:MAG: hypothetical protein M1838_005461 [Thelocarpon superellum]|nr:MAG: hypothetical protein M1838_005461 [Thelocarpon superellum]
MSTTQMAPRPRSLLHRAGLATHAQTSGLQVYFSSVAWIPSITRALLHLTVLAYSTSFITYLLDSGYSVTLVTFASSTGSAMDLGGTVLAPSIVHFFSARRRAQSEKTRASMHEVDASRSRPTKDTSTLERLGLIGISWQFFSLIPVTAILFQLRPISNASHAVLWTHHGPVPLVMPLFAFLLLSRMGYWAFDLTSAELTQVLAPAGTRAVYGGVEEAFRSLFQLSYWILTTVFGNPHYFQWLALGSLGSVGVAALAYAFWVMDREGERTFGEDLE